MMPPARNQSTGTFMKKYLPALAAALLLIAISPAGAIPIYGAFSGEVTGTGGGLVSYPVGTPVTGNYGYDTAVPWYNFVVDIAGQPFAGWDYSPSGLSFSVDANGFPVSGSAGGTWDLYINSGGVLGLSTFGNNYISAQVTYSTTSVPDASATWFLMCVALSGLVYAKRHNMPGAGCKNETVLTGRRNPAPSSGRINAEMGNRRAMFC
jgi:hypothetical protein